MNLQKPQGKSRKNEDDHILLIKAIILKGAEAQNHFQTSGDHRLVNEELKLKDKRFWVHAPVKPNEKTGEYMLALYSPHVGFEKTLVLANTPPSKKGQPIGSEKH